VRNTHLKQIVNTKSLQYQFTILRNLNTTEKIMPIKFFKLIIISAAILALTGCIRKVTESEANRTYMHYYKNNTLIKYEIANDSGQIIHQELYRNNRVVLNQSWNSKGILVYSSKYSKSGKIEIVEEYFDNGLHKFKAQV
jgi:hypothetical protein